MYLVGPSPGQKKRASKEKKKKSGEVVSWPGIGFAPGEGGNCFSGSRH